MLFALSKGCFFVYLLFVAAAATAGTVAVILGRATTVGTADTLFALFLGTYNVPRGKSHYKEYNTYSNIVFHIILRLKRTLS